MKNKFWVFKIALSILCLIVILHGCSSKTAIEKMIDNGNVKFENADFAGAAEIFTEVIKDEPGNLKAYFKLASANLCLDSDIDNFWKTINRITVWDPTLYDLIKDPVMYYSDFNTDIQKKLNDRKETLIKISDEISAFTNAINKNPDNAKLYFGRGCWYFFLNDMGEAINDFSSAIKLDKNFEKAFIMRGNCYRNGFRDYTTHNYIDYFEQRYRTEYNFRRAHQINPKNVRTMYEIMFADDGEERPKEKMEILSNIISIDSTNRDALFSRALLRINMKDYKGAMHDYALLVKNFPEESSYWVGLGLQKINLGMKQEGLKDLRKALTICKDKYYMKVIQGMIEKNSSAK